MSVAFFKHYYELSGLSALEHGTLEQIMGANLQCASTVKVLQLANAAGKRIFLANPGNYDRIKGQLSNYTSQDLNTTFPAKLATGETLVLPEDGKIQLNQWRGQGYIAKRFDPGSMWIIEMLIEGGYNGGFLSYENYAYDIGVVRDNTFNNNYAYDLGSPLVLASHARDPIDMASGAFTFDHPDLEFSGKVPIGMSFVRSYDGRLNSNKRALSYGWTHSLDIYLKETSHGEPGLGCRQPADAAPFIVGLYACLQLFRTQDTLQNWVIGSLTSKWAVDQLTGNAVTVYLGKKPLEFIRLPDGSYSPPPGMTASLVKHSADGTYNLNERFGTRIEFNANKQIATWTDVDQNRMTFSYNGSKLTSVTSVLAGSTSRRSFSFSYSGDLISQVTDSAGRTVSYSYADGNLVEYSDPGGKSWGYTYDASHRITSLSNPLGITTAANAYDSFGRVKTQTVPRQGGTNAVYSYYFADIRSVEVDPNGHGTSYYYDDKGREYAIIDALGNAMTKTFDGQDHVTDFVDQNSHWTHYTYDANDNVTKMADPYGNQTSYSYDSQFHLTDITDPILNTTHYDFDSTHHMTGTRDALANTTSATYYPNGLAHTRTDRRGVQTNMTYDEFGNPHTALTANYPLVFTDYDTAGHLLVLTDQVGAQTYFTYDDRGLLLNRADPLEHNVIFTYDDVGRISTKQDRNGNTIAYTYTPTGKVERVTYPNSSSIVYSYDSLDNLIAMTDAGTTSYTYDELNRLKSNTVHLSTII